MISSIKMLICMVISTQPAESCLVVLNNNPGMLNIKGLNPIQSSLFSFENISYYCKVCFAQIPESSLCIIICTYGIVRECWSFVVRQMI